MLYMTNDHEKIKKKNFMIYWGHGRRLEDHD